MIDEKKDPLEKYVMDSIAIEVAKVIIMTYYVDSDDKGKKALLRGMKIKELKKLNLDYLIEQKRKLRKKVDE